MRDEDTEEKFFETMWWWGYAVGVVASHSVEIAAARCSRFRDLKRVGASRRNADLAIWGRFRSYNKLVYLADGMKYYSK